MAAAKHGKVSGEGGESSLSFGLPASKKTFLTDVANQNIPATYLLLASDPKTMLNLKDKDRVALLQGTLDVLILRILVFGPAHGQGIARAIQLNSDDVLLVDHGALYPALQRLEAQKWIRAQWGESSTHRKARFYTLTAAGRKHLLQETNRWRKLASAIAVILDLEKLKEA